MPSPPRCRARPAHQWPQGCEKLPPRSSTEEQITSGCQQKLYAGLQRRQGARGGDGGGWRSRRAPLALPKWQRPLGLAQTHTQYRPHVLPHGSPLLALEEALLQHLIDDKTLTLLRLLARNHALLQDRPDAVGRGGGQGWMGMRRGQCSEDVWPACLRAPVLRQRHHRTHPPALTCSVTLAREP